MRIRVEFTDRTLGQCFTIFRGYDEKDCAAEAAKHLDGAKITSAEFVSDLMVLYRDINIFLRAYKEESNQ
jgi:hypothetical protein